MLGGSVVIALIRFAISLAGVIILFLLMSNPRFNRKKTMIIYGCFSIVLLLSACIWYIIDQESCTRMVAFFMYICFAILSIFINGDSV